MQAKNIEDLYELSPLQHGMLFENLYAPSEGTYVEQSVLTIDGRLDEEAFWRAWQLVVDRHPALRTTFHWNDIKKPVQTVHRTLRLPSDTADWRALPEDEQRAALEESLREQRIEGFDLEARPPMGIRLCRVADERTHVVLCFHHLILDGWSVGVILSDFMTAYKAFYHGTDPHLPPAGRYRDYVAWWQRPRGEGAREFWRDHMKGHTPPPPLDLGSAPPVPADVPPYQWADASLGDLAARIREFAQEHRITPHTLVQGAWSAVMSRCAGTDDVAVGTTFAHRPAELPHSESIVGCMVATVPIRTVACPDRTVLDYLRDIQHSIMYARDNAVADLVEIHDWSGVPRSGRLFESIVTYQNIPLPKLTFADEGIELAGYSVDTRPQIPLVLMVLPGDDLPLRLVHDRRRFTAAQADRLLDRVIHALRVMLAHPEGTLAALDALPGAERAAIEAAGRAPETLDQVMARHPETARRLNTVSAAPHVRLLDAQGRDVPLGATGEICLAGPGARHLAGENGATGGTAPGAFVHRTGTPGRFDDEGRLEILDLPGTTGEDTGPVTRTDGAPATETERVIAELMADILNLDEVGVHDNLVELGLHSLLGTRAVNRIQGTLKISVPLRAVFERPTVAELAKVVEAGGVAARPRPAGRRVDLAAEVTLDPAIAAPGEASWTASPERILLTGATGYLGTFLLERLLRTTSASVTCLVRDAEADVGRARVRDALAAAGLWKEEFAARIAAVPGNLSRPGLGLDAGDFAALAADVDEIYHLGAVVNILPSYRRVRPVNVDGTREILRLAATKRTKPVHYVSPAELTEGAGAGAAAGRSGREAALDPVPPETHNGYIESKWVADRLMTVAAERGIPTVVHRAARLVGSLTPAYWRQGDPTSEIVRACVHLGLVPDFDVTLPASPVDYVAAAIAALGRREDALGGYYHLVSPRPFSFRVVADAMTDAGYDVRRAGIDEWYTELVRLSARQRDRRWDLVLAVVGPWKHAAQEGWREPDYDTSRARAALEPAVTCPPIDVDYLRAGLAHFRAAGLIPAPAAAPVRS